MNTRAGCHAQSQPPLFHILLSRWGNYLVTMAKNRPLKQNAVLAAESETGFCSACCALRSTTPLL
uniref:Uncharacterized protein n=1 Tax=Erwinia amylovora ATCC BAA-2158 TaxID=889211 RepID=E5B6Y5_ERWAM|nr:hypothetical protein predicted by Glimmer/Critica [Erwinia amylovora ATCC BAA-2158]